MRLFATLLALLTLAGTAAAQPAPSRLTGGEASAARTYAATSAQTALTGQVIPCENGRAASYLCSGTELLSFLPASELGPGDADMNDNWGWTDEETGRSLVMAGRSDGVSFVEVTDPVNPFVLGFLPTRISSSVWRDVKVYDDHAYVVGDNVGDHGMQVVSLRALLNVTEPPVTVEPRWVYSGCASAHNIVILEERARAYVVGLQGRQNVPAGSDCGAGFHIVDLGRPHAQRPQFDGCFNYQGTGRRGGGYTHDAQCVVYHGPDADHQGRVICVGSNETAIAIADLTLPSQPEEISTGTYPGAAYVHQGWFDEEHRYFYQDDELDEDTGLTENTRTLSGTSPTSTRPSSSARTTTPSRASTTTCT